MQKTYLQNYFFLCMSKKLDALFQHVIQTNQFLTEENFFRILLLYYGINYEGRHSFPNPFFRIEVICSLRSKSSFPLLLFFRPLSPFRLIDSGTKNQKVLLYENEYVDQVTQYEETEFDMRQKEPFYFYVTEVNGDTVLKLNPIQLCVFFQNSYGNLPCSFCFRNDMVSRFSNVTSKRLISSLLQEKKQYPNRLTQVNEVSIITGSYKNDEEYLKEMVFLVKAVKKIIPKSARITVGSHEAKTHKTFLALRLAGVTDYTFPIESFSDTIRKKDMKNRKGTIPIRSVIEDIKNAITVFGKDRIIVRCVAGMGDPLNVTFQNTIATIATLGKDKKGPRWNINIYMPFTHYHMRLFEKKPIFDPFYLFSYCSTINEYVDSNQFVRFKISP